MSRLQQLIRDGLVRQSVPLAPLVTYRVGGPARLYAEVQEPPELDELIEALGDETPPILVLGRGSNLVVSDAGFDGLVIRLTGGYTEAEITEGGTVRAGGAAWLPAVARLAARRDRGGLEFLVGIPGSVGGAVHQNAGCHGSELVDVLVWVVIADLSAGSIERAEASGLALGYRTSNLTPTQLVTEASFSTFPLARGECEKVMRDITRWRRDHQPGGTHNAGSVFKNPEGEPAGKIIDQLGLKGFRVGKVYVSPKHANFFVAESGATAAEVRELVTAVQEKVSAATGIRLEPEIRFVGEFE